MSRRGAIVRAIALLWGFQLLGGLLIAAPTVGAIGGTGVGYQLSGDAVLFEAGGLLLSETLRLGAGPLLGGLAASSLCTFALLMLGLWPLATLLVTLDDRELETAGSVRESLLRSLTHVPRFVLLGGLTLLARALIVVALALFWVLVESWLRGTFGARTGDLLALAWAALGLALLAWIGIIHDLARAASVSRDASALGALTSGMRAAHRRVGAALVGWLTPAAWSIALLAAAAVLVGWIDVSRAGSWRVFAAFFVHQLAVLGFIALRALWLERALGLTRDEPTQAVAPIV